MTRPPGPSAFERAIVDARRAWNDATAVTEDNVRAVYQSGLQALARDIASMRPGSITEQRAREVYNALEAEMRSINAQTLTAIRLGITRVGQASADSASPMMNLLGAATGQAATVRELYQDTAAAATLAYLNRTLANGLTLSDSVWRAGDVPRRAVTALVQDAVVTGRDPRQLARDVEQYLLPGIATPPTPERIATAQNLGISANVAYQAVRLARTELNTAARETSLAVHSQSPFYRGVVWNLVEAWPRVPDICDVLAEGYQGTGYWPREMEPPGSHPNCRCFVTPYQDEDLDSILRDIQEWQRDPNSQPELQQWFSELQQQLPPSARGGQTPTPAEMRLSERQRVARDWIGNQGDVTIRRPQLADIADVERGLFGRQLTDAEWARLANAPAGAEVRVREGPGRSVRINAATPDGSVVSDRRVRRLRDGTLVMTNHSLDVTPAAPGGVGTRLAAAQLEQARELGIATVDMLASGDPFGGMNGYYTWPRLGFDSDGREDLTELPQRAIRMLGNRIDYEQDRAVRTRLEQARRTLQAAYGNRTNEDWRNVTVLDVMSTPEGRLAWLYGGTGRGMEFNVADLNSRNWRVLRDYLQEIGHG